VKSDATAAECVPKCWITSSTPSAEVTERSTLRIQFENRTSVVVKTTLIRQPPPQCRPSESTPTREDTPLRRSSPGVLKGSPCVRDRKDWRIASKCVARKRCPTTANGHAPRPIPAPRSAAVTARTDPTRVQPETGLASKRGLFHLHSRWGLLSWLCDRLASALKDLGFQMWR